MLKAALGLLDYGAENAYGSGLNKFWHLPFPQIAFGSQSKSYIFVSFLSILVFLRTITSITS
jgi:hypothetical protein